jgi:uncharacterized protein (DUF362 family)
VIRVGLARAAASYQGLAAPWSAPNAVHDAACRALAALGLDAAEFGSERWNPLGELVRPGGSVVLKPNFIRHWNPGAPPACTVESVITHGAVVRALADLAFRAVGERGHVTIAEAPQQDCDFSRIDEIAGLGAMQRDFAARGLELRVLDLRREAVEFRDGVITARRALPGDPLGYRAVDLGSQSFFVDSGLDARGFRGADYDPGPTTEHHSGGQHGYLLSESVLRADLIVNLPKWKTHKKTGVTLALKNLVGINGDKNWLPHHTVGPAGDEFPGNRALDRVRSRAIEVARGWLARGRGTTLVRAARRAENALRGESFVRSGNWHGNRTTWRMVCDLNRCVYYSDAKGLQLDAPAPVRRVLTLLDGIVAGEGEGPLAPRDVPLGLVLAALDPVALDLVAVRLMGFDAAQLPKVWEPMRAPGPRITAVRAPNDVEVADLEERALRVRALASLPIEREFAAHSGWVGHVESTTSRSAAEKR